MQIDDVYYLQLLLVDAQKAVNLVFSTDKGKDNFKKDDEKISQKALDMRSCLNRFTYLRLWGITAPIGRLHSMRAASSISTSLQKQRVALIQCSLKTLKRQRLVAQENYTTKCLTVR